MRDLSLTDQNSCRGGLVLFIIRIKRFVALFIAFISLLSCGMSYKVGNKEFSSNTEAYQFLNGIFSQTLAEISPTYTPVHGTALILYPTDEESQRNYITITPTRSNQEVVNYLIEGSNIYYRFVTDAIKKHKIFDQNEESVSSGKEYIAGKKNPQ